MIDFDSNLLVKAVLGADKWIEPQMSLKRNDDLRLYDYPVCVNLAGWEGYKVEIRFHARASRFRFDSQSAVLMVFGVRARGVDAKRIQPGKMFAKPQIENAYHYHENVIIFGDGWKEKDNRHFPLDWERMSNFDYFVRAVLKRWRINVSFAKDNDEVPEWI